MLLLRYWTRRCRIIDDCELRHLRMLNVCYRCAVFRSSKMFGSDVHICIWPDDIGNLELLKLASIADQYTIRTPFSEDSFNFILFKQFYSNT